MNGVPIERVDSEGLKRSLLGSRWTSEQFADVESGRWMERDSMRTTRQQWPVDVADVAAGSDVVHPIQIWSSSQE